MPTRPTRSLILAASREVGTVRRVRKGLWISRRELIGWCGAGIATAALTSASKAVASDASLSFDDFVSAANEAAEDLLEDVSLVGQDRYLRTLGAHAAGLYTVPSPAEWRDSGQGDGPGTYIGFSPGGERFVVLQWRMERGTRILPHAHTYGNVLTVGLEGSVRVRNFEVMGKRDYRTNAEFNARCTIDQLLSPGDVNMVSLERNYVHGFDAGDEGGRGLDITTRLKPRPDYSVPYLDLGERPDVGPADGVFRSRWYRR